jgi:uncharacterized Zn-finger protein
MEPEKVNDIKYVDTEMVSCTGEPEGDHPKVYYKVPDTGFVVCGYCNVNFMRKKRC